MRGPAEDCAYATLRRLTRCVAHHFDGELTGAGLKTTQLAVLSEVLRLQPVRPGELARALGIDPSTLTRNLKPLLAASWVEMGPGTDARTRAIRITRAGRAKQAEAQQLLLAARRSMDEKLGARRITQLKALMNESLDILAVAP
jgi:DNA-binding MarR family transcriptional regulator